jgi:hypothetical protein
VLKQARASAAILGEVSATLAELSTGGAVPFARRVGLAASWAWAGPLYAGSDSPWGW